ncbi:MAG: hypothetical protein ACC662_00265 [Planctomycetota bacterium]
MRVARLILLIGLAFAPVARAQAPPTRLLVPIYFYRGHTVGRANRPTGLMTSEDVGTTFRHVAWPELIASSVTEADGGRRLYLACGNGVMVSRDGGKTWRLTGGFRLTEVQKVAFLPPDPARASPATAYGVFATPDGGTHWDRASPTDAFRFATDVTLAAGGALWVATDRGLFVSKDGGHRYRQALPDVGVRRLLVRPGGAILAATDGRGLQASTDGGVTFHRVEGPPDVVFCVSARGETILCGAMDALWTSEDGGRTWRGSGEGMPEGFQVYGAVEDPVQPGRILAAGSDGLLVSEDGGRSFRRLAFQGALIADLSFARAVDVPRDGPSEAPGRLVVPGANERFADPRPAKDEGFAERRAALRALFCDRAEKAAAEGRWPGWATAAGEVEAGRADAALWKGLEARLAEPKHSMFFSLPLVGFYLHARRGASIPPRIEKRIEEVMTQNPVYRGDTENHWVMYSTAQLLAAQTWPETPAARWATGRSTQDIYEDARGWLLSWARLTAAKGQGEFDSPNYFLEYVTPMVLLRDFAVEPRMRQLAGMMLDLLLADYLSESLRGAWCGGHSRVIGAEVERTIANRVSVLHFLYAGGIPLPDRVPEWAGFAALSSYRPPSVFPAMANRRGEPRTQTEVKRVRNVIRGGRELNPPVFETLTLGARYGLGSLQGGVLQPIQQHTWDVTWLGSRENSTLFTVHPNVSAAELAMFFPEEIHGLTRQIVAQKGSYGSPDKLVSASPFERVRQEGPVLLALYQVPPGARFPHVNLYWPAGLDRTEEGGWLFGRDGTFHLACRPTAKGTWTPQEGWTRFRCPAARTGFVVVVGDETEGEPFDAFRRRILDGPAPKLDGEGETLTLRYGRLTLTYGALPPFPRRWLFRGPFLQARVGTRVIDLTDGRIVRTLDFDTFTVREER